MPSLGYWMVSQFIARVAALSTRDAPEIMACNQKHRPVKTKRVDLS